MREDDLRTLLEDLGLEKIKKSGDNFQFCCPFHGERHPSAGIHIEKLIGKCFTCGETFTLPKLVAHVLDIPIYKAINYIEEYFNVKFQQLYVDFDIEQKELFTRFTLPHYYIAPFKSGKVFHKYMLDRGFTKDTLRNFLVGWDDEKLRVTIPLFYEDETLGGVIGRAVLNDKIDGKRNPEYEVVYGNSPKYYIYEKAPVGEMLFPLNKVEVIDGTVILIEGTLDAMWLYQHGYTNTLCTFSNKMFNKSKKLYNQLYYLNKLGVKSVILFKDNDEAGKVGQEHDYKLLRDNFKVYKVDYVSNKKDPQSCTKDELDYMLSNISYYNTKKFKKFV